MHYILELRIILILLSKNFEVFVTLQHLTSYCDAESTELHIEVT
jgi:hypothetical protein